MTKSCFWVKSLDANKNSSVPWPLSHAVNCWEMLVFKRYGERHLLSHAVYVCSLEKNARQHMQTLCRSTIHMLIPLYLNNFFSGALWMPDPGRIWTSPVLNSPWPHFPVWVPLLVKRDYYVAAAPRIFKTTSCVLERVIIFCWGYS